MDAAAALVALDNMRSHPAYYEAEVLRRNTSGGAGAMASAPEDSEEYRAVLRLISTWEGIALIVSEVRTKDKIFEVTPISLMYRELKPAIEILERSCAGFGAHFAKLNAAHEAWLKKKRKGAKYVGPDCSAMHAKFG